MSFPPSSVLFVCMGNICRSPAAEIIFRKLVDDAGLTGHIEIDSAGTIGYHRGSPPDARMAETLRLKGYTIDGKARRIEEADLERFHLIVTMDEENLEYVRQLDESERFHERIRPLVSFCKVHTSAERVPDPYYGGQKGFDRVIELLEDGCAGILDELKNGAALISH
ncbi:MAG: low molecular weight protein-tyrosine-phosphatase [Luteolibacter sp.]